MPVQTRTPILVAFTMTAFFGLAMAATEAQDYSHSGSDKLILKSGQGLTLKVLVEPHGPLKTLVIWAPGGEVACLDSFFTSKPID